MAESPSELQAEIEKLERKHAENPEGRYFVPLANAYRKLGAVEHAEALLRAGLQRHPEYLSAHIVLGRCLADRQAVAEAAEEFRYVLSLDPQNLIALRTLGELAWSEGKTEEAGGWYQQLLSVDPMNEEARRALEGLRMPAAPAEPEEEFQAGRGWWQRPEEEDRPLGGEAEPVETAVGEPWPEEPLAREEPLAEEEPLSREEPLAEEEPLPPLEAAEPEVDRGDRFVLSYDDFAPSAEPEEAPPAPAVEPAPAAFESFGTDEIDLDAGFADEDPEPFGDDVDTGGDEVVTETIAELYLRQGFHDRAADVYRELIRRRGGDPALEQRLAELEGRGAAEPEPGPAAEAVPESDAPLAAEPASEPITAPEPEPEPAEEAFLPALAGLETGAPVPMADAEPEVEQDAFAESFSTGFTADPALIEAVTADEQPEGPSIRDALAELLSWSAPTAAVPVESAGDPWTDSAAAAEEPVEDSPGLTAGEDTAGFAALAEGLELGSELRDSGAAPAESGPESGTGSAGEPLFPWEEEGPASDELPGGWSPAADEPAGRPAATPPKPEVGSSAADEDDDLESFQAWLRSLKR